MMMDMFEMVDLLVLVGAVTLIAVGTEYTYRLACWLLDING
jgi:hypothetical protein